MRWPILAILALVSSAATAQPAAVETPAQIERHIERVENDLLPEVVPLGVPLPRMTLADRLKELHVPGVSIAVIHNGKIEWARGFGVTRIGGPKVTADTLFQAGSVSKPATAMAILHLVQSGKLDLDTDVNQYLTSWKIPPNQFTEKRAVTLRELLTHTAGVTEHGFLGYAAGRPLPTLVQVLNGEWPANTPPIVVDTEPGTKWNYSGGGYLIAQQLVGDVTGIPFPKLMQDTVMRPLGMSHSTFEQPLPRNRRSEAATPYDFAGDPVQGGPIIFPEMAPAGLWTTPTDLARLAIEVQKSLADKSNRVLSQEMTRQMLTAGLGGWGLGWQIEGSADHPYFEHTGEDPGFLTDLVAYFDGDGLVMMTNSENGYEIFGEVRSTIGHEYGWPDPAEHRVAAVDPKLFDRYVGHYKVGNGVRIISRKGDQLFERSSGFPDFRLFPIGDSEFFVEDYLFHATISFDVDQTGRATSAVLHQGGTDLKLQRIDDNDPLAVWNDQRFKRIDDQIESPDSERMLAGFIDELRKDEPNYDQLTPAFAAKVKKRRDTVKAALAYFGPVKSVRFRGVLRDGADIYDIQFEKGSTEWFVYQDIEGKLRFLWSNALWIDY